MGTSRSGSRRPHPPSTTGTRSLGSTGNGTARPEDRWHQRRFADRSAGRPARAVRWAARPRRNRSGPFLRAVIDGSDELRVSQHSRACSGGILAQPRVEAGASGADHPHGLDAAPRHVVLAAPTRGYRTARSVRPGARPVPRPRPQGSWMLACAGDISTFDMLLDGRSRLATWKGAVESRVSDRRQHLGDPTGPLVLDVSDAHPPSPATSDGPRPRTPTASGAGEERSK
jgi:hypothetical protein